MAFTETCTEAWADYRAMKKSQIKKDEYSWHSNNIGGDSEDYETAMERIKSKYKRTGGLHTAIDGLIEDDVYGMCVQSEDIAEFLAEEFDFVRFLRAECNRDASEFVVAFTVKQGRHRPKAAARCSATPEGAITLEEYAMADESDSIYSIFSDLKNKISNCNAGYLFSNYHGVKLDQWN